MRQECQVTPTPPPVVAPIADPTTWTILILFIAITIIDIWLYRRYRQSISRKILGWSRKWLLFRGVLLAGLIALTIHWVWGFPW